MFSAAQAARDRCYAAWLMMCSDHARAILWALASSTRFLTPIAFCLYGRAAPPEGCMLMSSVISPPLTARFRLRGVERFRCARGRAYATETTCSRCYLARSGVVQTPGCRHHESASVYARLWSNQDGTWPRVLSVPHARATLAGGVAGGLALDEEREKSYVCDSYKTVNSRYASETRVQSASCVDVQPQRQLNTGSFGPAQHSRLPDDALCLFGRALVRAMLRSMRCKRRLSQLAKVQSCAAPRESKGSDSWDLATGWEPKLALLTSCFQACTS